MAFDPADVLDISAFSTTRGFVSSSDDEDSDFAKPQPKLRSRLANIFGESEARSASVSTSPLQTKEDDSKAESATNSTASPNPTLFTSAAHLFVLEDGSYQPKGQCGVVIMLHNQKHVLIVYNAQKKQLASFLLVKNSLKISVKDFYVTLSSSKTTVSLAFGDEITLERVCTLVTILCQIASVELKQGHETECVVHDNVMFDQSRVALEDHTLKTTEQVSQKGRVSKSGPTSFVRGMKKGGVRILCISANSALVVRLKKHKRHTKESSTSSHVSENDVIPTEAVPDLKSTTEESCDVEADKTLMTETEESTVSHDRLKDRISKIGLQVLPGLNLPKAPSIEQDTPTERVEEVQPIGSQNPTPNEEQDIIRPSTVSDAAYSALHRVVGIEIDRLEIRLEAAVQGMINRAFEPLREQLSSIRKTQQLILDKLKEKEDRCE